jgi:uncharacterized phage protein gp47/JayE
MFEDKTYEAKLGAMMSAVPGELDKREGSMVYNALAPAALVMRQMYIDMEQILSETFADTASRQYLIKRAYERGIIPYPATKAVMRGVFSKEIPIGTRFSLEGLNYVTRAKIADYEYEMECETAGAVGHSLIGKLIPIDHVSGLSYAQIIDVIIPGEDEEATEDLRARYMENLETEPFGGNIADYKLKTNLIEGVGGTKVYPAWNGGGTVKLVIIDGEYGEPEAEFVTQVQELIDPAASAGQGVGIAPIGHIVTVEGVACDTISISMNITYEPGWDWAAIEPAVQSMIDEYFMELRRDWAESETLIVRVSQIEARMLDLAGVIDITATAINGVQSNYSVAGIPERGALSG